MTLEEQRQAAIITYVNLMRIKAHETDQNKELDYQIKIAKVMLQNFGIDFSELEYQSVPEKCFPSHVRHSLCAIWPKFA